ncbi:hypothetical protein GF340_01780 [Candidatus Peregrinibacteria bacterium]|nr:hypothetical protein [Candidatus Peregrinibacteria bacterium]
MEAIKNADHEKLLAAIELESEETIRQAHTRKMNRDLIESRFYTSLLRMEFENVLAIFLPNKTDIDDFDLQNALLSLRGVFYSFIHLVKFNKGEITEESMGSHANEMQQLGWIIEVEQGVYAISTEAENLVKLYYEIKDENDLSIDIETKLEETKDRVSIVMGEPLETA